jgi:hypothetical protein
MYGYEKEREQTMSAFLNKSIAEHTCRWQDVEKERTEFRGAAVCFLDIVLKE